MSLEIDAKGSHGSKYAFMINDLKSCVLSLKNSMINKFCKIVTDNIMPLRNAFKDGWGVFIFTRHEP